MTPHEGRGSVGKLCMDSGMGQRRGNVLTPATEELLEQLGQSLGGVQQQATSWY